MITPETRTASLLRAAAHHGVQVLYACESGSRAWGLASPDSDYDVRFVYRHPAPWYLRLQPGKDQIGPIMERHGELDLAGWDIRKFLKHTTASNPNCLEWLNSPIVYHEAGDFLTPCRALADHYFRPRRTVHHYLGIARGARTAGEKEDGRWNVKKACYYMRSILAAAYTAAHLRRPPVELEKLIPEVTDERVVTDLRAFVDRKAGLVERAVAPLPDSLASYFSSLSESLSTRSESLADEMRDAARGDAFFRNLIA
ncbi:DNA polymerase beta superfamily protein [Lewinella sp. IMCC34191]|uniref:nucleotidyltransferase domain-containing protein n=1 Tax=Lewinella sp. IMCC34191 TaxID=2259172 RepID=UPI0013005CCF|nr:nucleotidyltransferase domain-containing protein [Lewinella sp. IMCC34191]